MKQFNLFINKMVYDGNDNVEEFIIEADSYAPRLNADGNILSIVFIKDGEVFREYFGIHNINKILSRNIETEDGEVEADIQE